MKQVMIAVLGMLFIASCSKKQSDSFTVTGTIEHAPGKKVFLMEIPYSAPQPIVVDSVTLDSKGAFTLKGARKEEQIYGLSLENGPELLLVNDADEINIKLDVNNYRDYKVTGSPASESLHRLFEEYGRKDSTLFITMKSIDSLQKAGGNDSTLLMARAKRDAQSQEISNTVKKFISESPSPAARFYAIGLASRTLPPDELKQLVDQSVAKFKDHQGLAGLSKMLAANTARTQPDYPLLNQQAPEINMPDNKGKMISLSSFKGKYVLVDFWASWCAPCRKENPNVVAAYNKFKNKNFTILGVSLDQDKGAWQQAVAKDNLTWTHISDLKQWESAAVPAYGIEGIPFNVLVDPQGKIIASNLRGPDLEIKLQELLQ